jgi:hypothetical protein
LKVYHVGTFCIFVTFCEWYSQAKSAIQKIVDVGECGGNIIIVERRDIRVDIRDIILVE